MPLPADLQRDWPVISQLLDEALTLPPAQRAAFLDGLPALPAPLRDTLRELLSQADGVETADFLATLPRFTQGAARGPLAELAVGDTIGPYRLLAELGSGGMGAVWLAERSDGQLKRKVALKLPRLAWVKGLAERMARERDILATLEHPNIARLYDAGLDAMGRPYLALEYVEGQPIDVYAKERGLGVKDKLQLLLQVCSAVAYAHSRLVVHRDLKPSNILVTADGQVRLLDFGIAKLMEGDSAKETQLTQLAGRALTLDYASPEQIKGEPIGTASDVYSLGVVAYELLTGAKPYRLKRGSTAELEEAIATADPPKASDVAIALLAKQAIKGDLDAILNKTLKKSAGERYPTVDALVQDLIRQRNGEPVQAVPDGVFYRLRKLVRRRRLETAIVVGAVIALVGGAYGQIAVAAALTVGAVIGTWQYRRARQSATRADEERNRALLEVATSREVTQFVVSLFAVPNPPDIEIVDRGLARVRASDGKLPGNVRARLTKVLGDLYYNIGRYARAQEAHEEAVRSALSIGVDDYRTASAGLSALALDQDYLGDSEKARVSGERALAMIETYKLDEDWLRADASTALGVALTSLEDWAAALPHVQRAVRLNEALVGPHGRRTLAARGDEARLLGRTDPAKAEQMFRSLARDIETHLGRDDALYMLALQNFGSLLYRMDKLDEAEQRLRESIELRATVYGADHPTSANGHALLARVLLDAGKTNEACRTSERAIMILGCGNPNQGFALLAKQHELLSYAELCRGRRESADAAFARAVALLESNVADTAAIALMRARRATRLVIAGHAQDAWNEGQKLRATIRPENTDLKATLALLDAVWPTPDAVDKAAERCRAVGAAPAAGVSADTRLAITLTRARFAALGNDPVAAQRAYTEALEVKVLVAGRCPLWLRPAALEWADVLRSCGRHTELRQLLDLLDGKLRTAPEPERTAGAAAD